MALFKSASSLMPSVAYNMACHVSLPNGESGGSGGSYLRGPLSFGLSDVTRIPIDGLLGNGRRGMHAPDGVRSMSGDDP